VTHPEALDVALCWGGFDAVRKGPSTKNIPAAISRRGRAKSIWSQINREHIGG